MNGAKTRQKTLNKKLNNPKNDEKRVTILSDVRFSPENQAYIDLNQFRGLDLKLIDAKSKLPLKNKETGNINLYEHPVPSTSGTCKVTKRKTPNRKQIQTKKRKVDYDSDEESEDNYSLRDTSDEEIVMSEDEDMALCSILKHSKKYETDYYITETLQVLGIDEINTNLNNETRLNEKKDLHSKIDETNDVILDIDEIEINENEKAENFLIFNRGEIETKENECINEREKKEPMHSDLNNIGTKERADNKGVNSSSEQIKINEKTDEQYKKEGMAIDFDMDKIKIIGTEEGKQGSVKEAENLDLNQNEDIDNNIHEKKQEVISEIHENKENIKETIFYEKQSVLVRYYNRNNWKYYVGFIEKVNVQQIETYYSINYLKTVKKPNLRFIVCKRDYDVVPSSFIVKAIKLYSVKKNREYLVEKCDEHYF